MVKIISLAGEVEGTFLKRINRFLGFVKIENSEVEVHIHDTGRLGELLYSGNNVLLKRVEGEHRKTQWELIAARFNGEWILTNSSYHSHIFYNTLLRVSDFKIRESNIEREVKFGPHRLDFLLLQGNKKILIEVKGCTLMRHFVALFPDAPTKRGKGHVLSLIEAKNMGYEAWLVFLVMNSKAKCFSPNKEQDKSFSEVFYKALEQGIKVFPLKYMYDGRIIWFLEKIDIC